MSEIKIVTYRQWSPTGFDVKGLGLEDRQDWIVLPTMRTRDSGIMEESNFTAAIKILDASGVEYEDHRFGHWACGWIEIILIEPTDDGRALALEIADRLENCPLLDDDDHSEREYGAICDAWDSMPLHERISECVRAGASIFAARRGTIPEALYDSGRCYAWIAG